MPTAVRWCRCRETRGPTFTSSWSTSRYAPQARSCSTGSRLRGHPREGMSAPWSSWLRKTDACYAVNDIPTSASLSMEPKPVASSFPSGKENIADRISDSIGGGVSFVLGDVCPDFGYNGERLRDRGVSLRVGAVVDVCGEGLTTAGMDSFWAAVQQHTAVKG